MSSPIRNNSSDPCSLELVYQMGKYIQSFVDDPHYTEEHPEKTGRPQSNYQEKFEAGPNPEWSQTEKGLVLDAQGGMPSRIHTPCGYWDVLGYGFSSSGQWKKVTEAIKGPLGLEVIKEGKLLKGGYFGPYYAITKWEGEELEKPIYKKDSDYVPDEQVNQEWKKFKASKECFGFEGTLKCSALKKFMKQEQS